MTVAATQLDQDNVNRSIMRSLHLNWAAGANYTGRVFWGDELADPTAFDTRTSALSHWAIVRIVNEGAGDGVPTLVQVDLYSRVGNRGNQATTGDRNGRRLTEMAHDLRSGIPASENRILIYDFAVEDTPVVTTGWLIVGNSRGQINRFNERRRLPAPPGLQRMAVTIAFWHYLDCAERDL